MIQGSREEEAPTKQDVGASNDKAQTSSRAWSAFKNPRIVRMSRIGGKDRHSKVRTIRGLRDRRVRLSVPTAIQLYDLQDKLGFNQPSKVVDWLLSAAQHEIDKLPPLEMLQGNDLFQFPQSNQAYSGQTILNGDEYITPKGKAQRLASSSSSLATSIFNNNVVEDMTMLPKSISNTLDVVMRSKLEKEANLKEPSSVEKGNITEGNLKHDAGVVLENGVITYSPYYHLETPNAYSSHGQSEVPHGYLALLASYMAAAPNVDSKQYNHFQMAGSASENDPSNALRTSLHAAIPNLMVPRKNSTGSN